MAVALTRSTLTRSTFSEPRVTRISLAVKIFVCVGISTRCIPHRRDNSFCRFLAPLEHLHLCMRSFSKSSMLTSLSEFADVPHAMYNLYNLYTTYIELTHIRVQLVQLVTFRESKNDDFGSF